MLPKPNSPVKISVSSNPRTVKGALDSSDRVDLYSFKLRQRSSFNLNLTGLKANADVMVLNSQGKVVEQSRTRGKANEAIYTTLETGTYKIRVMQAQRRGNTRYQLRLSTANSLPSLTIGSGVTVDRGGTATFTGDLLKATDLQQKAGQLVYTLTARPQNGRLQLNGQVLGVGSTFTQADIDSGRLAYTSIGKVQLSNQPKDDFVPHVDGTNVVWTGFDGSDYEVYHYNLLDGTTTQLTNNRTSESASQISGNYVVWSGSDGGDDDEIFLHDLRSGITTQITNNAGLDLYPTIFGNDIAWSTYDPSGSIASLMFYNGATGTTTRLNVGGFFMSTVGISNGGVVWAAVDGNDAEIFFYDRTSTRQLTNNFFNDGSPNISGNTIVWEGSDGNDGEIFLFNGNTTQQLTNNSYPDFTPNVSGSSVAWIGRVSDDEVFFYNGSSIAQITDNTVNEYGTSTKLGIGISGNNLVWQVDASNTETSIFFYDGNRVTQLVDRGTPGSFGNISGNAVVWAEPEPGLRDPFVVNRNPFLYNGAKSDRFDFTVTDGLGGTVAGSFNWTIG